MTSNQFVGVIATILLAVGFLVWTQTVSNAFGPFVNLGN